MKKVLLVLISLFILVGCGSKSTSKENEPVVANEEQIGPVSNVYYYDQLTDDQKVYYDLILDASLNLKDSFSGSFKPKPEDLTIALRAFTYDYPYYFWWRSEVKTTIDSKGFTCKLSKPIDIEAELKLIEETANNIISECKTENNYQTILNIHNYLVNSIEYDNLSDDIHSIYGSLIKKRCACDGYALAFKYLLNTLNYNCNIIEGEAVDEDGIVEHAWNEFELNNKWYKADLTWDNGEMGLILDNFCVTDELIGYDHFDTSGYTFHNATDESLYYFNDSGIIYDSYDSAKIEEFLTKWLQKGKSDFYLRFKNYDDGVSTYQWLFEEGNFIEIFNKNVKVEYDINYGCYYNTGSHVLHVYFK